jgi:hypothetical protein
MPILHEFNLKDQKWIYDAICDNTLQFNETTQIYKYFNNKFPNKNYTKTFDPKQFFSRGDVVCFGGVYRNERKLIFDGTKLEPLYTEIDDYGSVPPNFVVGDNDNEFNIGDFENLIDHNSINWLSKEKLQQIELVEKNGKVYGKVNIKGKEWKIYIETNDQIEFNKSSAYNNLLFTVYNGQKIIMKSNKTNKEYLIKSANNQDINLQVFILSKNNAYVPEGGNMSIIYHHNTSTWYLCVVKNEYVLIDYEGDDIKFPLIWINKNNPNYHFSDYIRDEKEFNFYLQNENKISDKIIIKEIESHPITIEINGIGPEALKNKIKDYINQKIEGYDNIHNRISFSREGASSLTMYLPLMLTN